MSCGLALFALITGIVVVMIAWANVRYIALSEKEKAEGRKAAAMFFGDED